MGRVYTFIIGTYKRCANFLQSVPGVVVRSCKASAKQILRWVNEKQATFAVEILQDWIESDILFNNPQKTIAMKKNRRIALAVAIMLMAMLHASCALAQVKVSDKEIVGVWIMTSMKYDGEDREYISENYSQIKVYRANGEYACAEIIRQSDGKYYVAPHEYGRYTLKNGMYSEMGRKPIPYGWTSKTTSTGRWQNIIGQWKKVTDMPEAVAQHVVDKCKAAQPSPENIQQMMKKHIFSK